jgi:hypothetical protein
MTFKNEHRTYLSLKTPNGQGEPCPYKFLDLPGLKNKKRKDHEEFIEDAEEKTLRYLCELCVFAFGSKSFCNSIPISANQCAIKSFK